MNFCQTTVKLNKYDWLQKDELTNYQNESLNFLHFRQVQSTKLTPYLRIKKPIRLPFKKHVF